MKNTFSKLGTMNHPSRKLQIVRFIHVALIPGLPQPFERCLQSRYTAFPGYVQVAKKKIQGATSLEKYDTIACLLLSQ